MPGQTQDDSIVTVSYAGDLREGFVIGAALPVSLIAYQIISAGLSYVNRSRVNKPAR